MDFRSLARYFLITLKIMGVPFSFINYIYIHWKALNLLFKRQKCAGTCGLKQQI